MESLGRHLRSIVVATILASIILICSGVTVSLLWPNQWNPTLLSLLLNVIASLIGVLAAILAAIFIVERYLERRRHEHERQAALEEDMYQRNWQYYTSAGGTGVSYYIVHICLFLTCGKELYVQLTGLDEKSVPESVRSFLAWFQEETKRKVDAGESPMFQPSPFHAQSHSSREYVTSLVRAFKESTPREIELCPGDVLFLVRHLRRMETYLRDQIFLFQPFMTRSYGVAVAMTDLARELHDTIQDIKRMVSEVPNDVVPNEIKLRTDIVSKYRSLGLRALDVVRMTWVGRGDMGLIIGNRSGDGSEASSETS